MRVSIGRSELKGRLIVPSSKSYTIRALMCAALADGKSELLSPLSSDDTDIAAEVLGKIGVRVERGEQLWSVSGGHFVKPTSALFCRESAATIRFMTAVAAAVPGTCRLTAGRSLARRPIEPLISSLQQLGVCCLNDPGNAAITVKGGTIKGGVALLPGNISSQFVSALLLIAPYAEKVVTVILTTPLESRSYVEMTVECLKQFNITVESSVQYDRFMVTRQPYRPTSYTVEGDWSSASYLLALGALAGETTIQNLTLTSLQGDKVLLDFLKNMGARVTVTPDSITVAKSKLKAISADLTDCIDLLPTVAVLAAMARGTSEFNGINRARLKESDRISSVRTELTKAGIEVREETDRIIVVGSKPKGTRFDSHGDHRIAMALSLLGVTVGSTVIDGAECVSKTYPGYWRELTGLGAKVEIDG